MFSVLAEKGKLGVAKRSLHLRTLLIIIIIIFNVIVIITIIIISFKQRVGASLSKVASEVQLCTALILNGSMD